MKRLAQLLVVVGLAAVPALALAQPAQLAINLPGPEGPEQVVPALKILLLLTVLSLAPAILISMTSFTRIVVVLSFVRQALGTQNVPPTQVVMALSLLLTGVVMAPVAKRVGEEALDPYMAHRIDEGQAYEAARSVVSEFLLRQTREDDLTLMYEMSATEKPRAAEDVSLHLLVPAFLISELRTGFEMGFLLFLPFVLIDLIVAAILTSLGMVMVPPTMLSTPMKVLLFVVVDGWALLTRSIVVSFT
ncbi:MAG: flagellar type III secretion system pore protein FliP [Deltaproteobacteria bacterium]|nr:flagellar type III secretion system pore protein FliP [Deltaproteobacteria bacterium]